jgi:hypothetical protein
MRPDALQCRRRGSDRLARSAGRRRAWPDVGGAAAARQGSVLIKAPSSSWRRIVAWIAAHGPAWLPASRCPLVIDAAGRCTLTTLVRGIAGRVGRPVDGQGVRSGVHARGPKADRSVRVSGRPAFGLGPIARVTTIPAAGYRAPSERRIGIQVGSGVDAARTRAFGLPNLRRNVCPHFYVTGARGALPIQAPHLLKAIVRQDSAISRCQLRGGVHLEQGYVNDVCLSPRFNQCVFYEEDLTRR